MTPTTLPRTLAAWTAWFRDAEIPVFERTALELEDLRANEDAVDAHLLAKTISNDPLMTLKLLVHVAKVRAGREGTDAETVTAALVMLGITPFFNAFGPQPTVEDRLAPVAGAAAGLDTVVRRAHRAADFALGFAVHRMDHDAAVIHEATLLHDFAEMLLWCHAPAVALEIAQRQQTEPGLRSAAVQQELLGIELPDLQQALMRSWRLPRLLIRLDDDRHADSDPVRNVHLAIRLARHTAQGWDNPAVPDDLDDIAELLHMGRVPAELLVRSLDR